MKINEIIISTSPGIISKEDINLEIFKDQPSIFQWKKFELKKVKIGDISYYSFFDSTTGNFAAYIAKRPPYGPIRKFKSNINHKWKQLFNLYTDPMYRGQGLASLFYYYVCGKEKEIIISDDGQTIATKELWKNKLASNPYLEVWAQDLTTNEIREIYSSDDFQKNEIWIYDNYKVYLFVKAK